MRKGQRFTPARLNRWAERGRGEGTGAEYRPWHQVTRDDPSSRGRSHLICWRFGRLHHLLSDQELVAFGFATMLPGLVDLREQFPLSMDAHPHELATYQVGARGPMYPGTSVIAEDLGYKHPVVRAGSLKASWTFSTDLLLTLATEVGGLELLAISVKADEDLGNDRKLQLLAIEREYWRRQDVNWLLLTPSLFAQAVAIGVRAGLPWLLGSEAGRTLADEERRALGVIHGGRTLQHNLAHLADRMGQDVHAAQCTFWRAVWSGALPIDLAHALRPSDVVRLRAANKTVRDGERR
jgi:hypothetical protein